jgi:hypothetical protein
MQVVLRTMHLSRLTNLTSLFAGSAPLGQQATAVSVLKYLQALEVWPWPGMARDLAGLQQLKHLEVTVNDEGVLVLEAQLQQLGALTQLVELRLSATYGAQQQVPSGLALKLGKVLPHCMVRDKRLGLISLEQHVLQLEDDVA